MKQTSHFRKVLEARITEAERILSAAQQETKHYAARHADPVDQAASEYDRQAATYKAIAAARTVKVLKEALHRLNQGTYGECAQCGGGIELKRLEALPCARLCVSCQEEQERG